MESLRQILTVNSSMRVWTGYEINHRLTPSSAFTYNTYPHPIHINTVTSDFTYHVNANRSLSTILSVHSVFNKSIINVETLNTDIEDVDPVPERIVVAIDAPTPPSKVYPQPLNLGVNRPSTVFKLYYPLNVLYLTLPAPQFGDSDNYTQIRVNRYSRDQKLIIFRDPNWGADKILTYNFTYLVKAQKRIFQELMREALAKRVQILDHLGILRLGFFLTSEAEAFEQVKNGFSATLQFQQVD